MSFLFFLILAVTIPLTININRHLFAAKPLWALSKPFYQFVLWFQKIFKAAAPVMMGIFLVTIMNIAWDEGAWFVWLMGVAQIFYTATFYRHYFALKNVDFTTPPAGRPVPVPPYAGSKPAEGP